MNRDEQKSTLLLYRPGTTNDDPQMVEALSVAQRDPELAGWLKLHRVRQKIVSAKFREISVPEGLKEQILSEVEAGRKTVPVLFVRQKFRLVQMAAVLVLVALLAGFWLVNHSPRRDDTLPVFQNQMAGIALRGYAMDVTTNDLSMIRDHLAQNQAPSDFVLPPKLAQASLAGCAVEGWQDVKVSMICFRTGAAAPGTSSDLWLFVVDRAAVRNMPEGGALKFAQVNRLMTATWVQGDKLYYLGTAGDAKTLQKYL